MAQDLNKFLPPAARKIMKSYGGSNRRRKPRVSLDQLNAGQLDAFKRAAEEIDTPEDKRPAYVKVLDVLDVPRNTIANVVGSMAGVDKSKLERATFGQPRVMVADILDKLGVKSGPGRAIAGFVGDVAIDPLTYLTAGASTGTKLAQGLPRINRAGAAMLKTAARTGKLDKPLRAAVGAQRARRVGQAVRLSKSEAIQAGRKAAGRGVRDYSKLLKSQRGPIVRKLTQRVGQGNVKALGFFEKFGEKGRTLARIPFTDVKAGVLSPERVGKVFGKKAVEGMTKEGATLGRVFGKTRAYQAVKEGLADPEGFRKLAELGKGVQAARQGGVAAERMGKAFEKQQQGIKGIAEQQAQRMLPGPGAEGMAGSPKAVLRSEVARETRRQRNLGPMIPAKAVKGATKEAVAGEAQAVSALRAAKTAPDAPAVVRSLTRAKIGEAFDPNAGGLVNRLSQAKRRLFGAERSQLRAQSAGIESMRGARAGAAAERAMAQYDKQLAPILARFAKATGKSEDEIRGLIYTIRESGPMGENLASFGNRADAAADALEQAVRMGLTRDKETVAWLQQVDRLHDSMAVKRTARGMGTRYQQGYWARQMTPEARQAISVQEAGGKIKPAAKPGGKFSSPRPDQLARAQMIEFRMPDGSTRRIMSTQPKSELDALADAGGKIVGRSPISTDEMNRMSQAGGMRITGGEGYQTQAFKGPLFQKDPIKSIGAAVRQNEEAMAAAELRDLVEPYRVGVTAEQAAKNPGAFGHLTAPNKALVEGTPFAKLAQQANLYDNMYPPQITEMIDRLAQTWRSDDAVRALVAASDRTLGIWKQFTLFSPAYAIRNAWQNFVGGLMAGANPMRVAKLGFSPESKALRQALVSADPTALRGMSMNVGGRAVPLEQLYEAGIRFNMAGAGRTAVEMPAKLAGKQGQQYALQAANAARKNISTSIFRANMWLEDHQKLGTWLQFMEQGLDPQNAAMKTMMAMPDLSDLVHWEKNIGRRLLPWYSWMRKNGSLQMFHYLPKKPAFMAALPKTTYFAEGFRGADNVPNDLRPEWVREQMGAQVTGNAEGGSAFVPLNWSPMGESLAALSTAVQPERAAKEFLGMTRPGIKATVEFATGRNIFRGSEYDTGLDPLQLAARAPRALTGTSNTPLDTLLTLRPVREGVERIPAMQGPTEAAGRVFLGGSFQPLSKAGGLANEYRELTQRVRKIRGQIGRAQQANDLPLVRSLMVEYAKAQKRLTELGLPGVPKSTQKMFAGQGVKAGPPAFGR